MEPEDRNQKYVSVQGQLTAPITSVITVIIFIITIIPLINLKGGSWTLSFGAVLIVTFVMNHGILGLLNVEKGGFLEGMGVPLQMTGRVLYEGKSLSSSDLALIEAGGKLRFGDKSMPQV